MAVTNPYSQYLENQVMTATPGKLLIMAYDAAIKFCRVAIEKMAEHNLFEQSTNISKTQRILTELIITLNHKADEQLASNLEALYTYMFDRLTHANLHDDPAAVNEVIDRLTELRSAWAEAELAIRSGTAQAPAGTEAA